MPKILIIDDDEAVRNFLRQQLEERTKSRIRATQKMPWR